MRGTSNPAQERTLVVVLSIAAFAVVLNFTWLSPLLRPIALAFGVPESTAGQLGTIGAVVGVLATLISAPLMDRFSLAGWLRGQAVLLIAVTLLAALAPSLGWLFVARALAGLAVVLAKCLAACGDAFPDEARRNRAIGIVVSATTVAIVVGLPVLAQIESAVGWRWAVAAQLVPLALLLAGTWALSPQSTAPPRPAGSGFVAAYSIVLRNRQVAWYLAAMGVMGLVYIGWLNYFGAYVSEDFGAGAGVLAALFLVAGVAEMVANNVVPLALRRVTAQRLFAASAVVLALNLLATGTVYRTLPGVFVATAITSVCAAALYIAANLLLLDAAPSARGSVMALSAASTGLGAAIGTSGVGAVLALLDSYGAAYRLLGLVMVAGAVCVAVGARQHAEVALPAEPGFAAS
jgi:predicted MFS family arabinose efflux permease